MVPDPESLWRLTNPQGLRCRSSQSVPARPTLEVAANIPKSPTRDGLIGCVLLRVHGEFVNYAAIGIWNRPRQWCRQA